MPGRSRPGLRGEKPRAASAPGPVGLGEDVAPWPPALRRGSTPLLFRRSMRAERLPMPVSSSTTPESRQVRGADLEHVRAVLGEALRAGGTGEHAREVEDPDAEERTRAATGADSGGASPMRTISSSGWLATACACGWSQPLLLAAHVARAAAGGVDRILERLARPGAARFLGLRAIGLGAEHAHRGVAVVREVAVDADPAVAHRVEAAQRVPHRRQRLAVDAQIDSRCAARWPPRARRRGRAAAG